MADPTILLEFTSILGSIVPLFLMAKNKKIDYFALFFSQTELPTCRRDPSTDFVRFTLFYIWASDLLMSLDCM